ncbi:30S ribosomal protein S6e [Candidatus Woesearchaeota archaeon]|nr:30S ribosomal protein S6e [Candidatus Woesearchaeota archaeon]
MANFKLCISDPSTGKTFQKEVKDSAASPLVGLNIGENVKGDSIELSGYELQVTGGSDYCGFPMRKGILGLRKKIAIYGGVGFRGGSKGIKRRKTVCGHKIHDKISQVNLKVVKQGPKKLAEIFGKSEEKQEGKEAKEEAKPKEHKKEAKEEKIEAKEESKEKHKAAEHNAEEKKHEKPKEHKHEAKEPEAKEHKKEHKAEEKKE